MLLRSLRHQKHQLVKHLQHRQVRQQAQHLDLDQADHVQVTIHLLQHRVHRVLEIIHLLREVPDHVQAAAYLEHHVQLALVQADRVVQPAIVQVALADNVQADRVVQPAIVQVALADLVQVEIVQVALADLVQPVPVVVSQVQEHQVEHQVAHQVADQVVDRIQPVAAAILQELSENLVAVHQRVVNQSAQSVKSSTT
jgi:hypothetical protein